jgi:hypothetical protein
MDDGINGSKFIGNPEINGQETKGKVRKAEVVFSEIEIRTTISPLALYMLDTLGVLDDEIGIELGRANIALSAPKGSLASPPPLIGN